MFIKYIFIKYIKFVVTRLLGTGVDTLVLGCTHYVFVKDIIGEIMASSKIFDGNMGTINRLRRVLIEKNIKEPAGNKGTVILNTSADDQFSLKSYSWLLNYQTK